MTDAQQIDLLVHPWYGYFEGSESYGNSAFADHYQFLNYTLTKEKISKEDYANLLLGMYKERIDQLSSNSNSCFGLLSFRPELTPLEQGLMGYAKHVLGERAFFSLGDEIALFWDFYHSVENGGPVELNAYGEVSGVCVKIYAKEIATFFRRDEIPTEPQIIEELCGDLPNGKMEAWQRLRE